jgi:hypothetical protein
MPIPVTDDTIATQVVSTDDARQGESTGHVRYVLYASLALAVLAGIFLYVL